MVFTASLIGTWHLGEVAKNKPASLLVVSLGKALNGTPPPLCGRQVAQTPRKWQPPSECRRPIQNIAIQFAFSRMENKHGQSKKVTHIKFVSKQLNFNTSKIGKVFLSRKNLTLSYFPSTQSAVYLLPFGNNKVPFP